MKPYTRCFRTTDRLIHLAFPIGVDDVDNLAACGLVITRGPPRYCHDRITVGTSLPANTPPTCFKCLINGPAC